MALLSLERRAKAYLKDLRPPVTYGDLPPARRDAPAIATKRLHHRQRLSDESLL